LVSPQRPHHTVHSYDTRKAHIVASAENSLKKLRTDYLDVLLVHRPDPLMDADEVAEAFTELYEAGKVLHFGVSNFTTTQFSLLDSRLTDFDLVTNQIEFSVMHMEPLTDGTLDWCQMLRIAPMAWSPVGGGDLFNGHSEQAVRLRQTMNQIGSELGGASLDQVALAWILKHPSVCMPVLGTGKLERIRAAVNAEKLELSHEQWFRIWEASAGHEVP
jgi:predicted oxidoreductase